jgi:hypothetical protein
MTYGPDGISRVGCMFCGSEIDVELVHQTTGNKGCVSPTNPARPTARVLEPRVVHYTDIHFVPLTEDPPEV